MQTPVGKSGAHAGRDKKMSNPNRKLFDNFIMTMPRIMAPQASGDMSGWHKLRYPHEIIALSSLSRRLFEFQRSYELDWTASYRARRALPIFLPTFLLCEGFAGCCVLDLYWNVAQLRVVNLPGFAWRFDLF